MIWPAFIVLSLAAVIDHDYALAVTLLMMGIWRAVMR